MLYPQGKDPKYPLDRVDLRTGLDTEDRGKIFASAVDWSSSL
jgi:hypothetical protein